LIALRGLAEPDWAAALKLIGKQSRGRYFKSAILTADSYLIFEPSTDLRIQPVMARSAKCADMAKMFFAIVASDKAEAAISDPFYDLTLHFRSSVSIRLIWN
jgi:hypothetical protein